MGEQNGKKVAVRKFVAYSTAHRAWYAAAKRWRRRRALAS